ncbi:Protein W07G4.3 [Aphelenchoides avenae]|nr:Protein W07G4.3 [Aphelenchus avenae]
MPQWAGWALKTLSGKFYKSSTPHTAAASAEKPPGASDVVADKSRSESPAIPKKTVEKKPSEEVDGWGELDDDEAEVDAKPTEESKDEAWADDWNELSGTQATKPQSTLPSKVPASVGKPLTGVSSARTHKPTGGSLKLNPAVKKPTDDIDFNELVDAKLSNEDLFKPAATASSGWEHSGEWGADDNDWGDDGGFASSKPKPAAAARDNAAKKAEIAARNEQRWKELEAKRAAKGLGARKVTSKGD